MLHTMIKMPFRPPRVTLLLNCKLEGKIGESKQLFERKLYTSKTTDYSPQINYSFWDFHLFGKRCVILLVTDQR